MPTAEPHALEAYLGRGQTIALLGSSGVGKSTLINRWLGSALLKVNEVRASDRRGRHTISHRELIRLPGGALVIDTPGLRELQLWLDEETLGETFTDVEELARHCRFRDCSHSHEPDCAVQAALRSGALDGGRFQSYLRLQREVRHLEHHWREHEQRAEQKRFGRMCRRIMKERPKEKE